MIKLQKNSCKFKKENMLAYLKKQLRIEKTVTFGTIEGKYTYLIKPGNQSFEGFAKLIEGQS